MRTMMPHALEQVLLPHLPEVDQAEFIERMVNILLMGACQRLSEEEWGRLVARLRDWTGALKPTAPIGQADTKRRARC